MHKSAWQGQSAEFISDFKAVCTNQAWKNCEWWRCKWQVRIFSTCTANQQYLSPANFDNYNLNAYWTRPNDIWARFFYSPALLVKRFLDWISTWIAPLNSYNMRYAQRGEKPRKSVFRMGKRDFGRCRSFGSWWQQLREIKLLNLQFGFAHRICENGWN